MPAKSKTLDQDQVCLFGGNGKGYEAGTTAHTGDFVLIDCLEETVFSELVENGIDKNSDSLVGETLPAGTKISNGLGITAFTLTSGLVQYFNR